MEKSCGIVLFYSDEFLIIQHSTESNELKGHWDFPKGHVEKGESETQTALRELAEETGIKNLKLLPGFSHNISYNLIKDEKEISKDVTFFVGVTNETNVILSEEHQDYAWLTYDSAIERLTYNNAKESLAISNEFYLEK